MEEAPKKPADAPAKIGVSADELRILGPVDVRTEGAMEEGQGLALRRDARHAIEHGQARFFLKIVAARYNEDQQLAADRFGR